MVDLKDESQLRDYMAGQALAGLLDHPRMLLEHIQIGEEEHVRPDQVKPITRLAYTLADAMIEARNQR
jgi:hypothetical protein